MTVWESARHLVQDAARFDIPFKMAYVRTKLNSEWEHVVAKHFYLKSIEAFNGYFEEEPRKVGPSDFLRSFDELIDSIVTHGLQTTYEPIRVNDKREPVNGAHRVSIAACLDLLVQTEASSFLADWDHKFFVSQGLGEFEQYYGLSELLDINPNLRWVIVHSIVPEDLDPLVEEILESHCKIHYRFKRKLTDHGLLNLKFVNYFRDSESGVARPWIGSAESNFTGLQEHAALSRGDACTRFYLVRAHDGSNIDPVKRGLRGLLAAGHYGFHLSDSRDETRRVAESFAHPGSFHLWNKFLFPRSELLTQQLHTLTTFTRGRSISMRDFCLGGSAPLSALGLRDASDLDVVVPQVLEGQWERPPEGISVHHQDDAPYVLSPEEMVGSPAQHFYYCGFRFVSPSNVTQMKALRPEDKDLIDGAIVFDVFQTRLNVSSLDLEKAHKRALSRIRRQRHRAIAARIPGLRPFYRSIRASGSAAAALLSNSRTKPTRK